MISISTVVNAQTSNWEWAVKAGGSNIDTGASIAVDNNGNTFVTGYFSDYITIGSTTLTSSGFQDVFIAKAGPNGNWLWARKAGGANADVAKTVTVDAVGNAYVIGSFNSSIAYFGSIPVNRFTYGSSNDIFVAKIDANGNWIWAKGLGGISTDDGLGIAVDSNSNVFISGAFRGSIIVPTSPSVTLSSAGYNDIVVAKLNSSGTWLWAKKAGGTSYESGNGVAVDNSGNVYLTGGFSSATMAMGNTTLINTNNMYEVFLAKLDTNGNWLWAKSAGGSGADLAYAVTVDPGGNPVITGSIGDQANFGPYSLPLTGFYDIFVAKLGPSGNWLWASKAGGSDWDEGLSVDTDQNSNVFLTGRFRDTCQFGSISLSSPAATDGFVGKMSSSGTWLDVTQTGGSGDDCGNGIALDDSGNIYTCGDFSGSAQFGSYTLTSSGFTDVYSAKIGNSSVSLTLTSPNGGELWYTGSTHQITWNSNNISGVLLDFSLNNGSNWNPITTSLIDASPGTYNWTIPNVNTTQALVRIRVPGTNDVYDVSDNVFTIMDEPIPPVADFSADVTSGYEPLAVHFTDESVAGCGTITSWSWNFGDGGTSTQQNPQHTYQNAGVYDVTLTVTNSSSLSDDLVRHDYITVLEVNSPEAAFTANVTSGTAPLTVQFTDLSIPGSGGITDWFWRFGDGGTSTQQNPQHTYQSAGIYDVRLTVTNSFDLTSTVTHYDYITVEDPSGYLSMMNGTLLHFGFAYLYTPTDYQPIVLSNTGSIPVNITDVHFIGNPLHFEYQASDDALLINPGETDSIFVRFVPQAEGTLTDTLYIVNDSANEPLITVCLAGSGTVAPPNPPQNILVYVADLDVRLTWEPVLTNVLGESIEIDYYVVFINGASDPYEEFTYHGLCYEENYIHSSAASLASKMLYQVYAIEMDPNNRTLDDQTRLEIDNYLRENLVRGMSVAEFKQVLREAEKLID
ncbi:MAG: PKD domain-containing protein [Candidatus Syntrophosphaera sp.]